MHELLANEHEGRMFLDDIMAIGNDIISQVIQLTMTSLAR